MPTLLQFLLPLGTSLAGLSLPAASLEPAAALQVPRAAHQAVRLADGRLLLVGGCAAASCQAVQRSAELYDPARGRTQAVGEMTEPRVGHNAALLPGDPAGRVLVVGGWNGEAVSAGAERYDPATQRFEPLPAGPDVPRMDATLTPLPDGSLLLAGGARALNQPVAELERFDPATQRFVAAGRLGTARVHHSATPLPDGRVLIVGGQRLRRQGLASAEIVDPASGRSTPTGPLAQPRCKHAALALADGRVLVIGGSPDCGERQRHASSELFDPATGRFTPGPPLRHARYKIAGAVTRLPDGSVLVAGDAERAERWVPGTAAFVPVPGALGAARAFSQASALPDGSVLVSGGYDADIRPTAHTWRWRVGASSQP